MASIDETEIESCSLSHTGKVREDNQDAVRTCDPADRLTTSYGYLFGVADGMGGYAHGGVASTLALDTFFETYYAANGVSPLQKFRVSIQNANLSVYQAAQRMASGRMGTTLTAVSVIGQDLYVGHVGDSRAYLIRDNGASCLTNDHTRVGEMVRMKVLSPDKVRTHSQRSVLSRSLGLGLFVQPDISKIQIRNDDRVILCTDGIWSVIEDEEFTSMAITTASTGELASQIIDLALERDSDDNLSVITVHIKHLSERVAESSSRWSIQKLLSRWTGQQE